MDIPLNLTRIISSPLTHITAAAAAAAAAVHLLFVASPHLPTLLDRMTYVYQR